MTDLAVESPEIRQNEPAAVALMTSAEAAAYLNLTEDGFHKLRMNRRRNGLPASRLGPGGQWRFDKVRLDEWRVRSANPVPDPKPRRMKKARARRTSKKATR